MRRQKSLWLLLLLTFIGIIIGGLIGEFLGQYKYFEFLNYGKKFGINLNQPFLLDLNVIKLSFALVFDINIASIIGIILSIIVFRKF